MAANFMQQFRAVLRKNLKVNYRSRGTIKELVNLLVMFGVVMALSKTGNSSTSEQYIPIYMSIAIMMFCRGVAMNWVGEKQSKQA